MICPDMHACAHAWAGSASPQHGLTEKILRNKFSCSIIIVDPSIVTIAQSLMYQEWASEASERAPCIYIYNIYKIIVVRPSVSYGRSAEWLDLETKDEVSLVCIYIYLLAVSNNQSFHREIVGYGMSVGDHRLARRWKEDKIVTLR